MQIRILGSTLVEGLGWVEPGVGNFEPKLAEHLIRIGVAEPFHAKVVEPEVKKDSGSEEKPSSVSRPARASRKKTLKKSGSRD